MKNKNGFTILEIMVSMSVFAIVAGAAVALFQFQGKASSGANKRKLAGETVTLALMTIQRDIERAGLGLMLQQPLSVVVKDGGTGKPDEMYLSFSDHVSMGLAREKTYSFFDKSSSPGQGKLWFTLAGGTSIPLADVGAWIGTDGTAPPIGSVIRQQAGGEPDAVALKNFSVSQSTTQANKNQCTTVTLTLQSGLSGNVAPAISYKLIASTTDQDTFPTGKKPQLGTLLRNGMPLKDDGATGAGIALIGGWEGQQVSPIKVTDFQVRCGFRTAACNFADYYSDHSRTQCWAPDNGHALGKSGWEIGNLRVIEVTIKYIVVDKGAGAKHPSDIIVAGFAIPEDNTPGPWALGGAQTITVAPRNIVLGQYLGPPK